MQRRVAYARTSHTCTFHALNVFATKTLVGNPPEYAGQTVFIFLVDGNISKSDMSDLCSTLSDMIQGIPDVCCCVCACIHACACACVRAYICLGFVCCILHGHCDSLISDFILCAPPSPNFLMAGCPRGADRVHRCGVNIRNWPPGK